MRGIRLTYPLMVFICLLPVWAQQSATPPKWKQEFSRAQLVWQKGEHERAIAILRKTYPITPEGEPRARIAFRTADYLHQMGNLQEARTWYLRCMVRVEQTSDLYRRAQKGYIATTAPTMPALPRVAPPVAVPLPPAPAEVPSDAARFGSQIVVPLSVAFVGTLSVTLVVLLAGSGWGTTKFHLQVLLSVLVASAVTMMLPLPMLVMTNTFEPTTESWIAGAMMLGSTGCFAWAARTWQQGQLLRSTPLTRLRSAAHGFLKVRGVAEPAMGVVASQVGSIPAIFLHEVTERYVRRQEQYYDAHSKRWRTRTVYRWETIYSAAPRVDFVLDDGTGKAIVEVTNAEFYPDHVAKFFNFQPVASFPFFARVGDVRTTVRYIPPRATVTIWARYYERDLPGTTQDELRLQYDRFHKCMVVLEGNEHKAYSSRSCSGLMLAILGVALLIGVILTLLSPNTLNQFLNYLEESKTW